MAGIFADNDKPPPSAHQAAVRTTLFYRRFYLHGMPNRPCATALQTLHNPPLSSVGVKFHFHFIAHEHLDAIHAHPTGEIGKDALAVLKRDTKEGVGERLLHHARDRLSLLLLHQRQRPRIPNENPGVNPRRVPPLTTRRANAKTEKKLGIRGWERPTPPKWQYLLGRPENCASRKAACSPQPPRWRDTPTEPW